MIMSTDCERKCLIRPRKCAEEVFAIPASQHQFWLEEVASKGFVIISESVIGRIPESDRISAADSGRQAEFEVYEVAGKLMPSGNFWMSCPKETKKMGLAFRLTSEQVQIHLPNSFRLFQKP